MKAASTRLCSRASVKVLGRVQPAIKKMGFVHRRPMSTRHRAFVALGSNVGDSFATIEAACRAMESHGLKITKTSSLFKTKAMYVEDQNDFINGVCEIQTALEPLPLLRVLQQIEHALGRVKVIDKGPRNIDLDILLYDNSTVDHEQLTIPHQLMLERPFVLGPLAQILPSNKLPHPVKADASISAILASLASDSYPMALQTPLTSWMAPITPDLPSRKTHLMSILNLTPDSFSDGGVHLSPDSTAETLSSTIRGHISCGASIIDIGGQSTRPNAPQVGGPEELARVMPALKAMEALPPQVRRTIAVSIDTYRAGVARAAVAAGADIINDVSAGLLDAEMLPTMAELGKTVVLMHMRGTPSTMNSLTNYLDGVVETVGRELAERVRAAERAGVRRWRIILDPGIGFAKTRAQNLELLRRFHHLGQVKELQGLPWLVGASRKRFIGKITGVEDASKRGWGTAAAVTAAVQGGADIVRVHDVEEMSAVVKVSDAIWRVG